MIIKAPSCRPAGKKCRFFVGIFLVTAFSFKFLLLGLGSFFASPALPSSGSGINLIPVAHAELFGKNVSSNFRYRTGTLQYLKSLDLASFLGKPVKIPLTSVNPDGIPGGDNDFVIIYPPRILNKNTSVPLRAIYFSSGNKLDTESVQFVQNIEQFVNSVSDNNQVILDVIKNLIETNQNVSLDSLDLNSLLAKFLGTQDASLLARAEAAEISATDLNPLATTDSQTELINQLSSLDTSDPQVKQLLTLILLLILVNQSLATSLNQDKEDCINAIGGEWINGECVSEQKTACENNGGTFRKFANQCLADQKICGNEGLDCSAEAVTYNDNGNDNQDYSVYGCGCQSGDCLNDQGVCIPKEDGAQKKCENSGGVWRDFFSTKELCLATCGTTETQCNNANFNANINSNGAKYCDCSPGCVTEAGECTTQDQSKLDDDNDGVPNAQDRCPNSTPDGTGTVNKQVGSPYMGCTCTQIQAMGGIQKPQCPPDGCEPGSQYMVQYDRNAANNPNCQNGIAQQQQQQQQTSTTGVATTCPVISRMPDQRCADLANQNKNDNIADLLKKLLDEKNKNQNQNQKKDDKKDNGSSPGSPGSPPGSPGDNKNSNTNKQEEEKKKLQQTTGNDPSGVGTVNSEEGRGSSSKPFILHVSQFTKVCGENKYVLTNAAPGAGKFRDKPKPNSTATDATPSTFNTNCSGNSCPIDKQAKESINTLIKNSAGKIDKQAVEQIDQMVKSGNTKADEYKNAIEQGMKRVKDSSSSSSQNQIQEADNMKGTGGGEKYFKVPACKELASCHCCICGCCKCKPENCGWAVGKNCKESTCVGDTCKSCASATTACKEDAAKSIQLEFGSGDPFKCLNKGDKEATSQEKCQEYQQLGEKAATHNGQCHYDCQGAEAGCGDKDSSNDCQIIIPSAGDSPVHFTKKESSQTTFDQSKGTASFTNRPEGSILKTESNSWENGGWVKELKDEKGSCCKCMQEKDIKNPPVGSSPTGTKPPTNPQTPPTIPPNIPRTGGGTPADKLDNQKLSDDYKNFLLGNEHWYNWFLGRGTPTFDQYKEYRTDLNDRGIDQGKLDYWTWRKQKIDSYNSLT